MRVVDLDRDMRDVVPGAAGPDSEFLFARMTELTLRLAAPAPGSRILDVAAGFGQDALRLRELGARAVAVEPSLRMTGAAELVAARRGTSRPPWVRAWSDALPFAAESFDCALCKGALDHFDRPESCLAEMARVTRRGGRVVVAVANFASLSCRLGAAVDRAARAARRLRGRGPVDRGRRHYDVPSDHFNRYDLAWLREQAARSMDVERVLGIGPRVGFAPAEPRGAVAAAAARLGVAGGARRAGRARSRVGRRDPAPGPTAGGNSSR